MRYWRIWLQVLPVRVVMYILKTNNYRLFLTLDLGKVSNKQRLSQRCTNSGHQVAVATKCFTLAPNVCGSSVWNLLHVTILVSRVLSLSLDVWKKNAYSWFNTTFGFMFAFLKSCVNHLFLQEPVVKLHVFVSVFHVSNHLISWTVSPYVTKYLNCCYSKSVLCKTYCSR
jgi:hypothetical protein